MTALSPACNTWPSTELVLNKYRMGGWMNGYMDRHMDGWVVDKECE